MLKITDEQTDRQKDGRRTTHDQKNSLQMSSQVSLKRNIHQIRDILDCGIGIIDLKYKLQGPVFQNGVRLRDCLKLLYNYQVLAICYNALRSYMYYPE